MVDPIEAYIYIYIYIYICVCVCVCGVYHVTNQEAIIL